MIDVPRDWTFHDPTIHDWIHASAGQAIDISDSPVQHKTETELLLMAMSGHGKTAAKLGLAFTPRADTSGDKSTDPKRLGDAEIQSRLASIDALLRDTPAEQMTPLPVAHFEFPGDAHYPAASFTYIHTDDMGTILTQIWSIWRADGMVTLTLSYLVNEADKWSPVLHQISDSLVVE